MPNSLHTHLDAQPLAVIWANQSALSKAPILNFLIHSATAEEALGLPEFLRPKRWRVNFSGTQNDFVSQEIGQVATLILNGSGDVLERILARPPSFESEHGEELRRLTQINLSRRVCKHYGGKFMAQWRVLKLRKQEAGQGDGGISSDEILNVYRGALTATYLLQTGEISIDTAALAEHFDFTTAISLAEDGATFDVSSWRDIESELSRLESMLLEANRLSKLPEQATQREALAAFVVKMRRWAG